MYRESNGGLYNFCKITQEAAVQSCQPCVSVMYIYIRVCLNLYVCVFICIYINSWCLCVGGWGGVIMSPLLVFLKAYTQVCVCVVCVYVCGGLAVCG